MLRKWLLSLLLGVLLIASLPNSVIAAQPITVTLNGEQLHFDVPPVLENGRVLLPLRAIFEALDATVNWDGATNTVTATKGNDTVKLTVGKKTAYKNGASVELDVPAKVVKGRTLVPVRFISEALGATVQWDSESRKVIVYQSINSELELPAIEQVKKYLFLLNKAVKGGFIDAEWNEILSEVALQSGYGNDARVFRPMPGSVSSDGCSLTDIAIIKSQTLVKTDSNTVVEVTARYRYNDPTEPDVARRSIQYEKTYSLILEKGQLVIDSERTQKIRYADEIPLLTLSEREIKQIEQEWKENNHYDYYEILNINRRFISPVLSESYGIVEWGDTSLPSVKERFEQLLAYFSEDVKKSDGWKDFMELHAKRDPIFTVVWANSTQNHISATLFGDLYPGFNVTPVVMQVEIEKQSNDQQWLFTKIENVREYENLSDLKQNEPQTYELLVKMENYRLIKVNQGT